MTVGDPGPLTSGAPVVLRAGAIARTPELVAERGAERVLLVCGQRSFDASGAAAMLPDLEQVAEVRRWSDFEPNTDADDLARGLEIAGDFDPDLVLGVGGGSAMDMAKLVCAYAGHDDGDALRAAIRSGDPITARDPALILAPTTSGSGSEATHFAVVYIGEEKFSVAGDVLRPDAVVLDPALTVTAPAYQRATSGIDAVCQAIESRWATGATRASRRHADAALSLLLPAIEAFVTSEPSADSAAAMALGSHLAGRAIDVSKTTAAHALSYAITQRYGVSHGHAVALTLPHFVAAHADAPPDALQPAVDPGQHEAAIAAILDHLGVTDGDAARDRLLALMERLGLATTLAEVGVTSADERRALAAAVNVERLGNNPVLFDVDELAGVLDRAA